MECFRCKKPLSPHFACDVCECEICARCEKCDVRLCRNCDNNSNYLRWIDKKNTEVYWCDVCITNYTYDRTKLPPCVPAPFVPRYPMSRT